MKNGEEWAVLGAFWRWRPGWNVDGPLNPPPFDLQPGAGHGRRRYLVSTPSQAFLTAFIHPAKVAPNLWLDWV